MVQPGVQVIGSDGLPYDTLGDRTKRKLYAPKGPERALLGGQELALSRCAATGSTSPRSAGGPTRSSASASVRTWA